MNNYPCAFFFPRKIQRGPGILTGLAITVLTWFVVLCKLACGAVPHCLHEVRPLICLLLFLSGIRGYIVSSKPWQSQGWYSKLFTSNSKAFNNNLLSASVIIWAIQQCPFMPLHNIHEQCWQSSVLGRDVFSQIIARSESILKSWIFLF